MVGPRPKSPGWYPDPDILPGARNFLRYWNGRHWTDRWRPTPVLTRLEIGGPMGLPLPRALEGPARTADLPAPAAEVSATRDGPSGRADTMDRPTGAEALGIELPTSSGGGRGIPPQPPAVGGGGGGGGGDGADDGATSDRRARRRRRRTWLLFAGLAVLAAVAVVLIGQAMQPPSPGPRVLTDSRFVQLANKDCAQTLPTLRPADGGDFGSVITPNQAADQIDKAAAGLDDLANRLATLPAAQADQPHIAQWLAGWHQYDAFGRQYADDLRTQAPTGKAPPVLKTAAAVANTADNFARANGLNACLFEYTYSASPSEF